MHFPSFYGNLPRIWIDRCKNYFKIFNRQEDIWITTTIMHMEGNAAKWLQAYKQKHENLGHGRHSVKQWKQKLEVRTIGPLSLNFWP